jgi:hypothetical protein
VPRRTIGTALQIKREGTTVADLIGWLLIGVLVLLLGVLTFGFWMVFVEFVGIRRGMRDIRTQYDAVIRFQNVLQKELNAFKADVRDIVEQARLE